MNKEEIAHLKERARAEYERKIKAIELVEQMLAESEPQAEAPKLNGSANIPPHTPITPTVTAPSVPRVALTPSAALALGPTPSIDDDIETRFRGRSGWTVPEVLAALNLQDYQRGTVWNAVQRLVEARKVRVIQEGSGRRAAQYAWTEGNQQTNEQ